MAGLGPAAQDVARRTRVLAGHLATPAPTSPTAPAPTLAPSSNSRPLSSTSRLSASSLTPAETAPEGFEAGIIRGASVKYNDSAALRLRRRALLQWQPGSPSKVLIVKKPKNPAASAKLKQIGDWLTARGIQVYVERVVWATEFKEFSVFDPRYNQDEIDFCITLGGDGTVLYMTSLFEEDQPLPPVLCFAMGSLGFLTPFDASNFAPTLERVLDTASQPLFCTLRTRKRCEVVHEGQLVEVHHVLNECVLDRGAFPGAVLLEIFIDGSYVTNVEADGLIISTPSGSTAYSMSAGGPVVAPSVPCTVLTPIAPLSLSFRPVVIPESSSICVHLPTCVRSHARASFDGKRTMRVRRGTSIFFTTSLCPLPVISLGRMDTDWYEGITSKLKWNQAIRQLPSCPSPVGAKQQELCSARHADRTSSAAAAITAAMDGCPIGSDGEEVVMATGSVAAPAVVGQSTAVAMAAAAAQERESERDWLGPAGSSLYGTSSGEFTDWGAGGSDGGISSGHASDDNEAPEAAQPLMPPPPRSKAAAAAAAAPAAPVPVAPRRPGGAGSARRYSAAAAGGGGGLSSFQNRSSATKAGGVGSVPGQEESVLVPDGSISDSLTDAEEDMAASLSAAGASGASVDTISTSAASAAGAAAAAAEGGRGSLRSPRAPAAGRKVAAPAPEQVASPGRLGASSNGRPQKPRRP